MLEKAQKTLVISHLCLVFSLLLFLLIDPFLGTHFVKKQELLNLQNLQGSPALLEKASPPEQKRLLANQTRFQRRPLSLQKTLLDKVKSLESAKSDPLTLEKAGLLLYCLIAIPLTIHFLRRKTAWRFAFLLLPLILAGIMAIQPPESEKSRITAQFFPSETWLRSEYGDRIDTTLSDYDFVHAVWEEYLMDFWGDKEKKNLTREERIEEGQYRFQLALFQATHHLDSHGSFLGLWGLGLAALSLFLAIIVWF